MGALAGLPCGTGLLGNRPFGEGANTKTLVGLENTQQCVVTRKKKPAWDIYNNRLHPVSGAVLFTDILAQLWGLFSCPAVHAGCFFRELAQQSPVINRNLTQEGRLSQ